MSSPAGEQQHVLQVEVVTPDGPIYTDEARMVIVPGADGELGVLARHMPLIARLAPGETRVQKAGENWVSFATGAGYFKVQNDLATVLVQDAEPADKIDVDRARSDAEDARARISAAESSDDDDGDLHRARRDLADAENRLRVAGQ